jgi:hypothetical protein
MKLRVLDRLIEMPLVQQVKRAVPVAIRSRMHENMAARRQDAKIARSPDRAVLTERMFPALAAAEGFARGADVLWIGCRRYTQGYYQIIERQGARCWTLEIDPDARRWGRRGRHVVGNLLELDRLFPATRFGTILCNGVFGFGVNTRPDQRHAAAAMARMTRANGWLLLGWNTDRISDPVQEGVLSPFYESTSLSGIGSRQVVEGCTHVFDVLRRGGPL